MPQVPMAILGIGYVARASFGTLGPSIVGP